LLKSTQKARYREDSARMPEPRQDLGNHDLGFLSYCFYNGI